MVLYYTDFPYPGPTFEGQSKPPKPFLATTETGGAAWTTLAGTPQITIPSNYYQQYQALASLLNNAAVSISVAGNIDAQTQHMRSANAVRAELFIARDSTGARYRCQAVYNSALNVYDATFDKVAADGTTLTYGGTRIANTNEPGALLRLVRRDGTIYGYIQNTLIASVLDTSARTTTATQHGIGGVDAVDSGPGRAHYPAEFEWFRVDTLNNAPTAPTRLGPDGGVTRRKDQVATLSWQYNDIDTGDYQSKADVSYGLLGTAYTNATQTNSTQSTTVAANTLLEGDYSWRVRTYDSASTISPYSTDATFTVIGPVATVTTYNLAQSVSASATAITLLPGQGRRLPGEGQGGYYLDLDYGSGARETVYVRDRSGLSLFVLRAQGGTAALTHPTRASVRYDSNAPRPVPPVLPQPTFEDYSLAAFAGLPRSNDPAGGRVVNTSSVNAGGGWYLNTLYFEAPRAIVNNASGAVNVPAPDYLSVGASLIDSTLVQSDNTYKITGVSLSVRESTQAAPAPTVPGQAVMRVTPTRLNYAPNANFTTTTTTGWEVPESGGATLATSRTTPWVGEWAMAMSMASATAPTTSIARLAVRGLQAGRTYRASVRVLGDTVDDVALRVVDQRAQVTYADDPTAQTTAAGVKDDNARGANPAYRVITATLSPPALDRCAWSGPVGASASTETIGSVVRANLCPNPALATGSHGWSPGGAGRIEGLGRSGAYAAQASITTSMTSVTLPFATAYPDKVAMSVWLWSDAPVTATPRVQMYSSGVYSNTDIVGDDLAVLARTWTRVSMIEALPAASNQVRFQIRFTGTAPTLINTTDCLYEDVSDVPDADATRAGRRGLRPYFDGYSQPEALVDVVVTRAAALGAATVRIAGVLIEERAGGDFFDGTTGDDYSFEVGGKDGSGRSFYYAGRRAGTKALSDALVANTPAHTPVPAVEFDRLPRATS